MQAKHQYWVMKGLKAIGAPSVLAVLAALVFTVPGLDWAPIDHLETFAGCKAVTHAERKAGRTAISYEIKDGDNQDILSDAGFANAVYQTLRMAVGSGCHHAPVCSSWVWVSRGSTGRSSGTPLGNQQYQSVRDANVMTARVMILCLLAAAKGCWFTIEQPSSSLMERHPTFQRLLTLLNVRRLSMAMGDFGGATPKSTFLYSSHTEIDELLDHKATSTYSGPKPEMVVKYIDKSGKRRCKGGAGLKDSQHYPRQFGVALAAIRTKNLQKVKKQARKFLRKAGRGLDDRKSINAHWLKHANIMPVLQYLSAKAEGL